MLLTFTYPVNGGWLMMLPLTFLQLANPGYLCTNSLAFVATYAQNDGCGRAKIA